jgi:hypothetical protein
MAWSARRSPFYGPRRAAAIARLAHVVVATVVRWSKRGRRDRGGPVLAVSFGLILVTQPGARLFVVTAVAAGFIFTVISVSINRAPAINPSFPRGCSAPGTRSWLTS